MLEEGEFCFLKLCRGVREIAVLERMLEGVQDGV